MPPLVPCSSRPSRSRSPKSLQVRSLPPSSRVLPLFFPPNWELRNETPARCSTLHHRTRCVGSVPSPSPSQPHSQLPRLLQATPVHSLASCRPGTDERTLVLTPGRCALVPRGVLVTNCSPFFFFSVASSVRTDLFSSSFVSWSLASLFSATPSFDALFQKKKNAQHTQTHTPTHIHADLFRPAATPSLSSASAISDRCILDPTGRLDRPADPREYESDRRPTAVPP